MKGLTMGMKDHGQDIIFLRGSRTEIRRNVHEDANGRTWVVFYGKLIEVEKKHPYGYATIEMY